MAEVLLIEPDRVLAEIYGTALTNAGHTVRRYTGAQAGIEAADEHRPDVVILELQLVAQSGVEFLYEFRSYADWQDVPIIILSHVPKGEFAGCRALLEEQLGVRAYLYKPRTSLRQLLRMIDRLAPTRTMKP